MTSQADACSYCMGSVVLISYGYTFISGYFEFFLVSSIDQKTVERDLINRFFVWS